MELNEIEHKIATGEMNAAQVFTQMKQHINAARLEAIGWTFADDCVDLNEGRDPRKKEVPEMLERARRDLCA